MNILSLVSLGETLINKIWPDPAKQAEELRKLKELEQTGDLAQLDSHVKLMVAQLEVNKVEAASASMFIAGWRPAIGWVGAVSLGLMYIPKTIMITALWSYQTYLMTVSAPDMAVFVLPPFPDLGLTDLLGLLGSMLGIGVMRSFDKTKGTDTKSI